MNVSSAVEALRRGEVVGVPTDTLYGLAVDPFQQNALESIFVLKSRPQTKPLPILVASIEQAIGLAVFSDHALDLVDAHWPGALTLILPRSASTPQWLGHGERRTIGLRCPDHSLALELLEAGGPLAVTSANLSGQTAALDHNEAKTLFGDSVSVYLEGSALGGMASTVLDLTESQPVVIREGPVLGN